MKTLADFLQWYNNLDVTPMVDACDTLCKQYNDKGIDSFKQALSSPGISLVLGMREVEEVGYRFPLINESNKDFHYKVSQSIVGGPSIVFNQVNIAGETQIQHSENVCRKIQGYDANSLYPYCMQQFLPVNCWYRRRADESYNLRVDEWMVLTRVHLKLNF